MNALIIVLLALFYTFAFVVLLLRWLPIIRTRAKTAKAQSEHYSDAALCRKFCKDLTPEVVVKLKTLNGY